MNFVASFQNGRTASYYMQNPGVLTHKQLLADINAPESIADESFSDKGVISQPFLQRKTNMLLVYG